jgi:hypothetical protein
MSDKVVANKAYQRGYADGYRRGVKTKAKTVEHMHTHPNPMYVPYLPITYYTGIILMLAMFLIFILILGFINERPIGYVTKYKGDCLLKLSSTYSAIECL